MPTNHQPMAWRTPGPVTADHPLECLIVLSALRQSDGDWWADGKFFSADQPIAWLPDSTEARAAVSPTPAAPTWGEPVAWIVYWGLSKLNANSVHLEKATAEKVASEIESYTEVHPLYAAPGATHTDEAMVNGLTEAETSATASVAGLTGATPPVWLTDERIDEALYRIDRLAREVDADSWGLPMHGESLVAMRAVILGIATPPSAAQAEGASEAYYKIDRFLRNNLDDTDYAEFSGALDALTAAPEKLADCEAAQGGLPLLTEQAERIVAALDKADGGYEEVRAFVLSLAEPKR